MKAAIMKAIATNTRQAGKEKTNIKIVMSEASAKVGMKSMQMPIT